MYRTRCAFWFMLAIMSLAGGVAVRPLGWAQSEVPEVVIYGEPVVLAGVANDSQPTYSPDGSQIAFSSTPTIGHDPTTLGGVVPSDIYVMNADGTSPVNLTRSPHHSEENPSWSPDGSKIAFYSTFYDTRAGTIGAQGIYVMNADGTNPIKTNQFDDTGSGQNFAWSPDISKIAFTCNDPTAPGLYARAAIHEICVMNADGTNLVRLTHNSVADSHPTWSPDGSKIAFASSRGRDFGSDIYVMNADGTSPVNLTELPEYDPAHSPLYSTAYSPLWLPGGFKIAFRTNNDTYDNPAIYVMNADGTNPVRLTRGLLFGATWSLDGSKLAFAERCSECGDPGYSYYYYPLKIHVYEVRYRRRGALQATLLNLSPWQAWVHLYCLKDQGTDAAPCAVTFECNGFSGEPVTWPVEVAPKTIFSYWPNKTVDGTSANLQDALTAAGKPPEEARRRTTCEVFSPDPLTVRGYTLFGDPTLVPVAEPARPDVSAEPGERRRQATLPNLSPWQAWVHLYCLKDRAGPDADPPAPCAVTFECNGQSGEPVTWPVEVAPKTIFSYWPNKTVDGVSANLQAALMAAGKPVEEARRRTTCEVSSPDPIAVRGYTRFNGQPPLVPVPAYPLFR